MTDPKFAYDQVEVDSSKIREYDHSIYGPTTVFEDVVIAREIVQKYEDGRMAYKPADELEASYWTADGMWAIAGGHPETVIIMDRDQMQGKTVNPRFKKNLIDPKTKRPNNRGTIADLEVYNNKVSPETLKALKSGEKTDVSIGFTYLEDDVGGTIDQDGHPLNGVAYDYVQRKIAINHTAFALDVGRCPMPFCGIGADEIRHQLTGDPVGPWKTWGECVAAIMKQNPDYTKEQAEGTCGKIEKQTKKKDAFKTALENMKSEIETALAQFEEPTEQLKEDEAQEVGDSMSLEEIREWFGKLSEQAWAELEETQRQILISLYNDKHPVVQEDATESDVEEEDCEDCEEDEQDSQDETDSETEKKVDEFDLDKYMPEEEKFDPSVVIIDRIQ